MIRSACRVLLVGALVLGASNCRSLHEPSWVPAWAADLNAPDRVLYMRFVAADRDLSGTGWLVPLTSPGALEDLTVSGSRRADTLDIIYQRPDGGRFGFSGWYVAKGAAIVGVLDGGEFSQLSVIFRMR